MLKPSNQAKYFEKAKELDKQWKKDHRKLLLILLISIVTIFIAAVIFYMIFPEHKGTIIIGSLLLLSGVASILEKKKIANRKYYNRQFRDLERLETEEEMKNWEENHG